MRIMYGVSPNRRDQLPELRLVNMFIEETPTDETGIALLSCKGLTVSATRGLGPVQGVFQQPGVFDGDTFAVSGGVLYRESSSLGTLDGTGPVAWAGRNGELLVTRGATLYSYDGATLAAVTFPVGYSVIDLDFHDGLFLAATSHADGSHRYYWSAVLDGRSWDDLDFASAESKPDSLLGLRVINDTLVLFGDETIEPWANVGDADAPYQRMEQRIYAKGLKATGALVEVDQALFFVSHDNMVCVLNDGPVRISNHGLEAKITSSTDVSCFGYTDEGHSFLCVRLTDIGETWSYDIATKQWHERATSGRTNFRVRCATKPGGVPMFGDDLTGDLYTLAGWDDADVQMERLFTSAIPIEDAPVGVDTLRVHANVGRTEVLSGQGSDPVMEMRSSRDAGRTWSNWRPASLGAQGAYRAQAAWRRMGQFEAPGAMFQMRVTDPVPVRVSGVFVNEAGGGRSR